MIMYLYACVCAECTSVVKLLRQAGKEAMSDAGKERSVRERTLEQKERERLELLLASAGSGSASEQERWRFWLWRRQMAGLGRIHESVVN